MNNLNALILMGTLHCIADYPLQGDFLANIKGKNFFLLLVHSFIWSGIVYLGLLHLGMATPYEFAVLFVVHAAIDKWKCNRPDKTKALTTDLYWDQAAHAVQILVSMYVLK